MADTSRDPADLHPYLQEAWDYLRTAWNDRHPEGPLVELSATYRGPVDQQKAYEEGFSNAPFGQSFHNFHPAYAFDVYFNQGGVADWSFRNFQEFGEMAEEIGLEWGGRWRTLVDGAHVQLKDMTLRDAAAGVVRNKPNVPIAEAVEPGWMLVILNDSEPLTAVEVPPGHAIFTRVSMGRRCFYVDVRPDSV
jgi:hypothetical protein